MKRIIIALMTVVAACSLASCHKDIVRVDPMVPLKGTQWKNDHKPSSETWTYTLTFTGDSTGNLLRTSTNYSNEYKYSVTYKFVSPQHGEMTARLSNSNYEDEHVYGLTFVDSTHMIMVNLEDGSEAKLARTK